MRVLACLLLAASARADLTIPVHGAADKARTEAERKAEDDADTGLRYPKADEFKPMIGSWSGPLKCPGEAFKFSLKFDIDDPRFERRAFITYALQSNGGFASGYTLKPQAKPGVYLGHEGSGKGFPDLEFDVSDRILVAHTLAGGMLKDRVQVRLTFDPRWSSAAFSLRRGDGYSCSATLRRGLAGGPR
jgi:hypothetical protein